MEQTSRKDQPFQIIGNLALEELHDAGSQELPEGFSPEDFDLLAQLSVSFNGEAVSGLSIRHRDLMKGGNLVFEMAGKH